VILEVAGRALEGAHAAGHVADAAPPTIDDHRSADEAAEQQADLAAAAASGH
jgi:hypothetical protein